MGSVSYELLVLGRTRFKEVYPGVSAIKSKHEV